MHSLYIWSLVNFLLAVSFAADNLDTPNLRPRADDACTSIAQQISGSSQVYFAGLKFLPSIFQQAN